MQSNTNKQSGFINIILIIVGFVLVFLAIGFFQDGSLVVDDIYDQDSIGAITNETEKRIEEIGSSKSTSENAGEYPEATSTCGFYLKDLAEGETITSPLLIEGNTDGCGWGAFEANVGVAELYDLETGNKISSPAIMNTTTDWMTAGPVYFEANLTFTGAGGEKEGYILFTHQQVADEDPLLTYVLPVKY
ncbi:hypothetical protein KC842_03195 [Candidatus Nomurabacteria bacterium]|nr:hypothetical protein [Candidatus Nomurabacteria bacterium]USN95001.1 MAG: hypothetical protein H6791_01050 [Candidatus Nomurabacteria bacterium]